MCQRPLNKKCVENLRRVSTGIHPTYDSEAIKEIAMSEVLVKRGT